MVLSPPPGIPGLSSPTPINRIVGILSGGAGQTDATDITYATPYWWLETCIKKAFPDSYLYPILV